MRFNIGYHVLAIIAAAIVIGLRYGDIRDHAAWSGGSATTRGRIDDITATNRVRTIKYIYTVDNKAYTGQIYSKTGFVEGGTALVTYAKSDPSVSTLQPEKIDSIYRTSIIISVIALLPMLIMWFLEIAHRFKKVRQH